MEKPCFPPLLIPGFHDLDENEIKSLLVEAFPKSIRRSVLHCNYIQFLEQLKLINKQIVCFSEVWIDGSFTTEKLEPDDIDILLVVDFNALNLLPSSLMPKVSSLLNRDYIKLNYDIDVLLLPENHPDLDYQERRSYWRGWFGFDRKENPKGLVRVML